MNDKPLESYEGSMPMQWIFIEYFLEKMNVNGLFIIASLDLINIQQNLSH